MLCRIDSAAERAPTPMEARRHRQLMVRSETTTGACDDHWRMRRALAHATRSDACVTRRGARMTDSAPLGLCGPLWCREMLRRILVFLERSDSSKHQFIFVDEFSYFVDEMNSLIHLNKKPIRREYLTRIQERKRDAFLLREGGCVAECEPSSGRGPRKSKLI